MRPIFACARVSTAFRVADLLDLSKRGDLLPADEAELGRYLAVEHLVRLAKAHAHKRLTARE